MGHNCIREVIMTSEELATKIRAIKGLVPNSRPFSIPVRSFEGIEVGALKPVDVALSHQGSVVESLARWRQMYMDYFLTQFVANPERTAHWLQSLVIPSHDRILFLICENHGLAVGNFSVCNVTPREAELDNLIRGEQGGDAQLIFYSEVALLSWLYWQLDIEEAFLHVFTNNTRTIRLHTRVGFQPSKTYRLSRIVEGQETRFLLDSDTGEVVDFQCLRMTLHRDRFVLSQPWAVDVYKDFRKSY
jgi:hypothetical protein